MLGGNKGESEKGKSDRGLGGGEEKFLEERKWKIEEVEILRAKERERGEGGREREGDRGGDLEGRD